MITKLNRNIENVVCIRNSDRETIRPPVDDWQEFQKLIWIKEFVKLTTTK